MKWPKKRSPGGQVKPPAVSEEKPVAGERQRAMAGHGILGFFPSARRRDWVLGLLIVIVTLIAYGPQRTPGLFGTTINM
jgi:hypothetical protein